MKHVAACIDGSASTLSVCDYASWAALRLETPLTLFHVLDETRYPAAPDMTGNIGLGSQEALREQLTKLDQQRSKLALEQGHHMLESAKQRAIQKRVKDVNLRQRHGDLTESLQEIETSMRLLVIGLHGENTSRTNRVGSQLETVVRTIHQPILVAPEEFTEPKSVMLAFDGSDASRKGIRLLAESPIFRGLPLHLVMIGADTSDSHASIEAAANHLTERGHNVRFEIRSGDVEPALHAYQKEHNIDLMVMGAYGHSRIRQFFVGSTTTNLLQTTNSALLLLH
ncbi:universal stress protein [Idiomarina aminovorans]|uniref:universal stress protein n=1 Tax=Idiomarina aminovorans TaxID=2914829 RepID=UPI0020067869|nr:universal stress protein [Idiomarina sp. ATCH4]MCK7459500.1 universal stress protein [Idiomarina sp. ATCH4]